MIAKTIMSCSIGDCEGCMVLLGLHWLRDDVSVMDSVSSENASVIVPFSNVLFLVENFVMILIFYFSQHSNSWFSLPVTVCVCLFSVIGSTMRIAGFCVFSGQERDRHVMDPPSNSNNNSAPAEIVSWTSIV